MTIQIRKASRKKARLRLGLSAPSGAGKTLGSLLLAYGIIRDEHPNATEEEVWDKIGIIDTEEGSGELYVGVTKYGVTIGEYRYVRLSAPFTAAKYLEAQRALEAAKTEFIIHDSLTHAWSGSGGLLEKQGKLTDADPKKNSYTAWRHITPEHNALVDAILQSPAHIAATMRSKVEYAMETNMNGKQQVRKLGMAPIQREGMEYEFTVFFDIDSNSYATATKDRTDLFSTVNATGTVEKRTFIINPALGKELSAWLNTGLESLDILCEKLAKDVAISTDLQATYEQNKGLFDRIDAERPAYRHLMMELFDLRDLELNPQPKTEQQNTP